MAQIWQRQPYKYKVFEEVKIMWLRRNRPFALELIHEFPAWLGPDMIWGKWQLRDMVEAVRR